MLQITCDENIKDAVIQKVIDEFAEIDITVDYQEGSDYPDFEITETETGFELTGQAWQYPLFDFPVELAESGGKPGKQLGNVKKEFPDIDIRGSLLFGDDNYREYAWFASEPGNLEITEDFSVNDAPLSSCWFAYVVPGDNYGPRPMGISSAEEFIQLAHDYTEWINNNPDQDENADADDDHPIIFYLNDSMYDFCFDSSDQECLAKLIATCESDAEEIKLGKDPVVTDFVEKLKDLLKKMKDEE